MNNKDKVRLQLEKFIPLEFTGIVADLIFSEKVKFKVSKPRKTKLGDYRAPFKSNHHEISVNSNLNKWAFLITTLHEFAHMHTFIKFGNKVKSHGLEWKNEFATLLLPILNSESIPNDIRLALNNSLGNLKASSCSDIALSRVLKRYDDRQEDLNTVEELKKDDCFKLNNKIFKRGELRRKRFLCTEINSGKLYLIHCLAEVEKVEE